MAKIKQLIITVLTFIAMLLMMACSNNKNVEALELEVDALSSSIAEAVADNPQLLADGSMAEMADGAVDVTIVFGKDTPDIAGMDRAVLDFFLGAFLKANPGAQLDNFINTLSKAKYQMVLTVADQEDNSLTAAYTAQQLAKLLSTSQMQLNFNEAKTFVLAKLESLPIRAHGEMYQTDFRMAHGFATYVFTYPTPRPFAGLIPGNLKARYLKVLQESMQAYGSYTDLALDTLQKLGIDGFRFEYCTPDANGPKLSVAIPLREL